MTSKIQSQQWPSKPIANNERWQTHEFETQSAPDWSLAPPTFPVEMICRCTNPIRIGAVHLINNLPSFPPDCVSGLIVAGGINPALRRVNTIRDVNANATFNIVTGRWSFDWRSMIAASRPSYTAGYQRQLSGYVNKPWSRKFHESRKRATLKSTWKLMARSRWLGFKRFNRHWLGMWWEYCSRAREQMNVGGGGGCGRSGKERGEGGSVGQDFLVVTRCKRYNFRHGCRSLSEIFSSGLLFPAFDPSLSIRPSLLQHPAGVVSGAFNAYLTESGSASILNPVLQLWIRRIRRIFLFSIGERK